jgi:very-short-patch-repair endonuclease
LLHRGVYVFGDGRVDRRGRWLAAVLACGDGALLSHRSAATLWGLMRSRTSLVDVSAARGRSRAGIALHETGVSKEDRTVVDAIPVTTVARTILDLADVVDEHELERTFEEADRRGLLRMRALEDVCVRGYGRRGLKPLRRLIEDARAPEPSRSALEDRVLALCRKYDLPSPQTNVEVLGHEVDAFWPRQKLMVEADSWSYHRHRAAFERDRIRDAAMQAAGYRVVRVTHRRLERAPASVADELARLLAAGEGRAVS